jgi:hypothetical protein
MSRVRRRRYLLPILLWFSKASLYATMRRGLRRHMTPLAPGIRPTIRKSGMES